LDTVIAGLTLTEKKLDIIPYIICLELRALKLSFLGNIVIIYLKS